MPDTTALFLDFDGTLVEIAPRPDAVRVDPDLVPTLERLRERLGGALAIVTGRPIEVIDDFLAPARFDVAGLHGVALRRGGVVLGAGAEGHPALRVKIPELEARLEGLEAVLIEDKGASVAVHWRLASERDAERAQAAVEAVAAELAGAYRLQLGKAVGEIVPATATKAAAIRTFLETQPYAGRRPVFLGDDRTDEIAFTSVNNDGGISIRVGAGETVARKRLGDPVAVRATLRAWAEGAPIDPDALADA
ncbi:MULTISPECIES: trehalose-phosphatase [Methylobacterium]|uniref:Trehalose 6-phosphate phosphatase n=3 Tax=Pseudomonadota TaxID=1224 RepID=A0ABQ4ST37_9HYPH|nr:MULTISPECIES: trehalose-phosphatase [Methylobacterium]PIU07866.1 MAG: trehalose-phosphatase [Methylobacterium sp. CG09_land_8_20_14_0_10_71_15]PIU11065.1 MAG: trehalose-phosphatase [Methylobacterium sp. CG08_land_8_20_14_0_20_71_15]GBU16027.1 trehalose-6-phosphate phosphatase [Methylobacterium sp.]GJE05659.1 Trehalose-6-phosphate phosphatase [Methylobacterium jeotgali]